MCVPTYLAVSLGMLHPTLIHIQRTVDLATTRVRLNNEVTSQHDECEWLIFPCCVRPEEYTDIYNMASRNMKKSKQQQRDDARKWSKGKLASNNKKSSKQKMTSAEVISQDNKANTPSTSSTSKQKSRAEAKERARNWARATLGKNKAVAAKKKPMSAASKAEAKARARKWAKERFGETSNDNDSLSSDIEDEDDEINSRFCRMGIASRDEEFREGRRCEKNNAEGSNYSFYSGAHPQSSYSSNNSRSRNNDGRHARREESQHGSNNFHGRRFGTAQGAAPSYDDERPTNATSQQYTEEQAEVVNRVIRASKSGTMSHYKVLNVRGNASNDDIKKAYRRLALQIHPDKNLHPSAAEAFQILGSSYEILKSESKRARYDRQCNHSNSSSTHSFSRSGQQYRTSSAYYGNREEAYASYSNANFGHGFYNRTHNPFGGRSRPSSNPFGFRGGMAEESSSSDSYDGGGSDGSGFYQSGFGFS